MSEKKLINEIQLLFSSKGHRIFRQNVGIGWSGETRHLPDGSVLIKNPRPLRAGLCLGSSDLIGWRSCEITIDMVGQTIAQIAALEIKYGSTRTTPEQAAFIAAVKQAGGYAAIIRHIDEIDLDPAPTGDRAPDMITP